MKFKVGDIVKVIHSGKVFPGFTTWSKPRGMTDLTDGETFREDVQDHNVFKVIATRDTNGNPKITDHDSSMLRYGIESIASGRQQIIREEGIKLVEKAKVSSAAKHKDQNINPDGTTKRSKYQTSGFNFL